MDQALAKTKLERLIASKPRDSIPTTKYIVQIGTAMNEIHG